jgi:Tol biopolymer transport system component
MVFRKMIGSLGIAVIMALWFHPCTAQEFGKNKVQYKSFDWYYLQAPHFDVYYYEGQEDLAYFVAQYSEDAYNQVKKDLRHEIRKRIPIILYRSHNDFQQTNVILELLSEGVGGFTEFFKNRVVLPYTGSQEEYRHVLHHEVTHAIMMDMLYGGGMESLVRGQYFFVPPLWFVEGLAEYQSLDWDKNSDMFMRDATITGYLYPLNAVGGYMNYKQGQSVVRYIAHRYGGEKLGEILSKARLHRNMEKGLKSAIGMSIEELDEEWSKIQRMQYWPEIASRQDAAEIARQLTDHTKDGSGFNLKPTFSPAGNQLAYFSNRSDYTDIYLLSAIDGEVIDRLVKGERSGGLESLAFFRSSIGWAPDGSRIAFVAKSGGGDALYLLRVKDKKILKKYQFPLDLLSSPSWSPQGERIVFTGLKDGFADLYDVDLRTGKLTRLTSDRYDDAEPVWSPDGGSIAFSSDRPAHEVGSPHPDADSGYVYGDYNIFTLDLESGEIQPVIVAAGQQKSPTWSPQGDRLCYCSDENGISNLYIYRFGDQAASPLTDVIGGCFTPSWAADGKRLAFAYFQKGGWDVFVIKDPLEKLLETTTLAATPFVLQETMETEPVTVAGDSAAVGTPRPDLVGDADLDRPPAGVTEPVVAATDGPGTNAPAPGEGSESGSDFVTGPDSAVHQDSAAAHLGTDLLGLEKLPVDSLFVRIPDDSAYVAVPDTTPLTLRPHKYKIKFTPDVLSGTMGYDTYYGFQGQSVLAISDLLGNHRFYLLTSLFYSLSESDFQLAYYYLPRRIDYGLGFFHLKNYFIDNYSRLFSDRLYGGYVTFSRPFNKFDRFDVALQALTIDRYYYDPPFEDSITRLYQVTGSLVHDTVLWGNTGPVNGSRWKLTAEHAPRVSDSALSYTRFRADYRRYIDYRKKYNFVFRLTGGGATGDNAPQFYLGGTSNWVDANFFQGDQYYSVEDIYFANRITPLRGYNYNELQGSKFGLLNLEFRYPFIDYLIVHWPLRFGISQVNGALFFDMGSAWDTMRSFKGGSTKDGAHLEDLKTGFGFGMRANLGIFVLRFDTAWKTDFNEVSAKPKTYYSLGAEF